jgi:uncharacterized membrane protein YdjX (TVP38/TMEM64 family)
LVTIDPQHLAPKGHPFKRFAPIAAIAVALVLAIAFRIDRYISIQALCDHREWLLDEIERIGVLPAALAFAAAYAVVTALSIPGAIVFTMTAGFLFGPVWGTAASVCGATLGAIAVFLAARTAFGDTLRARAGPWVRRLEEGFRENALNYLLVLRLVPIFPFWLINLVPAFLGVGLGTFVLATFFGVIPGAFVYASVGNGLGALLEAGEQPDAKALFQWSILLPILGLAVLALVPVFYKHLKRPQRRAAADGAN